VSSKEIDPVGVDYVLQKLGFTHARVTIPKWMQRGFMDPLDKFLSILIEYAEPRLYGNRGIDLVMNM
jgi:hypothetical protein